MSLQDENRQLNEVPGSVEASGCETKGEPSGQPNRNIQNQVARSVYFRLKLLRRLVEGHSGADR